jgi:hypothetical protein
MKFVGNFVSFILFLVIVGLAPTVVRDSLADQRAKSEIANINHIMYGLFSVNAWKDQISDIVIAEIGKLDLKTTAKKLKTTIENQLTAVIDKLNEQVKESNKGSLGGKIKQALINLVVDVEDIKKGVPKYADAIIEQMTKPETQKIVKDMATKQVRKYVKKSFTEQNMEPVEKVLDKTETESIPEATKKLNDEIDSRRESLEWRCYGMIGAAILLFAWAAFPRHRTGFTVCLLFLSLIVMLGVGVSIPMIDLEAKIKELSFILLGHKITFENQILYFQSKSVLDVFWLMITHADLKMKFVGVLLVTFSLIVPTFKMGASILYFFKAGVRSNRFVQFLAFKIGKWSMADVMVIAIMMSYIGFNGIVEAQFKKMHAVVPKDMTFFTTNGTTLQMGYFIFITYVLLAMVLSSYVHMTPQAPKGEPPFTNS